MRSTQPIGAVLLGALIVLPMLAAAEEMTASGNVRTNVKVTDEVVTARGEATGKATSHLSAFPLGVPVAGTRMMATGTRTMPTKMQDVRERVMGKRAEILKRLIDKLTKRMNAAIDRLTKLADRLDSRIAKEKARGVDTSAAQANLAIARTKLADARAAVTLAENAATGAVLSVDATASSTKLGDVGKSVREALDKAKDAVFLAHKALVDAIASLKGVRVQTGDVNGDGKAEKEKSEHGVTTTADVGTTATH